MRRRLLGLYLLMATVLALCGVAYAAWTSEISIDAHVSTGIFGIRWTGAQLDRSKEAKYRGQYVADVEMRVDGTTIVYTVRNAYPGWESGIKVAVENTGTVPATITEIEEEVAAGLSLTGHQSLYKKVIEPGEATAPVLITVKLGNIDQGSEYTFTLDLIATQWNLTR